MAPGYNHTVHRCIRFCKCSSCATQGIRRSRWRSCSFLIVVCLSHSSTELSLTVSTSLSYSRSMSARVVRSACRRHRSSDGDNAGSTIAGVHRMMGHLGGHILRPVVVGGWRCLFWAQLGVGLTQNPPKGRYRPCLIRDEKPTIPRPVTVLAPASLRTAAITSDPQLRLLLGPTIGRICGARGREFDRNGSRCADPDGGSALQESTA